MNGVRHATSVGVIPPIHWRFWAINAAVWSAYAGSLMIPWLDRYTVLYMLPNKLAIAATGVAVSGLVRAFYRWLDTQPQHRRLVLSALACIAAAFVLDTTIVAITQGAEAIPTRFDTALGSVLGGVPVPGRVGNYLILMIAWSLAYHMLRDRRKEAVPAPVSTDATISVSGTTVRLRDGSRTILLERDEIDWIAADGDYIRLHCGPKNLLIRATMKQSSGVLTQLGFVRIHRSAIVNPDKIREVVRDGNDHSIVLKNGVRVRAGRNYFTGSVATK